MTLTSLCPGPRGGRHLRGLPVPLHGRPAVPRGGAGREQPDDRARLPPPHCEVTAGHSSRHSSQALVETLAIQVLH